MSDSSTAEFEEFLNKAQAGDSELTPEASRRLERVHGDATAAIRRYFGDSVDLEPDMQVASAFRTFFRRLQKDPEGFVLETWDDLAKLIVTMAYNKSRNYKRKKRPDRLPEFVQRAEDARDPQLAVEYEDLLEQLMNGLDETDKKVLEMWLNGRRISEMAKSLQTTEANVKLRREKVKKRLRQIMNEGDHPG